MVTFHISTPLIHPGATKETWLHNLSGINEMAYGDLCSKIIKTSKTVTAEHETNHGTLGPV
jgi:hypothetical protein